MKRSVAIAVTILMISAAALAGTLSGKVSGASGTSVVYVDTVAGKTFPAPDKHVVIDQKGLLFQPHVTAIQVGTTVDFLNSDNVAHNVFWPSVGGDKKATHNLGTWPKGQKKSFKFDKPGAVPLLCNVHPEMSGFVIVSPTPYFAETDAQGNYKIADVPDGDYKVVAWHEGSKAAAPKAVSVKGDTKADLTVSK
jgi:plastocyanin